MLSLEGFFSQPVCGVLLFLILGLLIMIIYRAVQWKPGLRENSTQTATHRNLPLFKDEWENNNSIQGSRKLATEHDEYQQCGRCSCLLLRFQQVCFIDTKDTYKSTLALFSKYSFVPRFFQFKFE